MKFLRIKDGIKKTSEKKQANCIACSQYEVH